jgi:hypothetical protein
MVCAMLPGSVRRICQPVNHLSRFTGCAAYDVFAVIRTAQLPPASVTPVVPILLKASMLASAALVAARVSQIAHEAGQKGCGSLGTNELESRWQDARSLTPSRADRRQRRNLLCRALIPLSNRLRPFSLLFSRPIPSRYFL